MNFSSQEIQSSLNSNISIKFLNDDNDISSYLNNGYNKFLKDINDSNKINIKELEEFCNNLLKQSEFFNKNLEDWYDDKYYSDLEQFNKNLFEEEDKINLFEESNSIIIR